MIFTSILLGTLCLVSTVNTFGSIDCSVLKILDLVFTVEPNLGTQGMLLAIQPSRDEVVTETNPPTVPVDQPSSSSNEVPSRPSGLSGLTGSQNELVMKGLFMFGENWVCRELYDQADRPEMVRFNRGVHGPPKGHFNMMFSAPPGLVLAAVHDWYALVGCCKDLNQWGNSLRVIFQDRQVIFCRGLTIYNPEGFKQNQKDYQKQRVDWRRAFARTALNSLGISEERLTAITSYSDFHQFFQDHGYFQQQKVYHVYTHRIRRDQEFQEIADASGREVATIKKELRDLYRTRKSLLLHHWKTNADRGKKYSIEISVKEVPSLDPDIESASVIKILGPDPYRHCYWAGTSAPLNELALAITTGASSGSSSLISAGNAAYSMFNLDTRFSSIRTAASTSRTILPAPSDSPFELYELYERFRSLDEAIRILESEVHSMSDPRNMFPSNILVSTVRNSWTYCSIFTSRQLLVKLSPLLIKRS